MIGYIYKTTNLLNGKIYVGKHEATKFEPSKYIGSGKILKLAVAKDGIENFKNELLDTADTLAELWVKEEQWIEALDARNPAVGYNIAKGGEGGNLVQGYKWYNDGSLEYYLPPDVVPEDNLIPGRLLKVDNSNTVWINNGEEQKHIKKDKLAIYLQKGWTTGMLDRGETWLTNIRKANKEVQATDEWKQKQQSGISKFHKEHPHWTNQTSWEPGHITHNKGKISVTNGEINKFINQNDLDTFIANNPGWYRGNTQIHKEKKKVESKQIVEALQMQPLSEEEKASRHILGRLYGPIATCKEGTRNGRKYNKALWEKALADDIFKEKVATKSLFLELGHPADREETDMTCVCACIPETPKIINDDLYAYVDILDTPNGRLLKTLCDYGFVPGISSRGSGDIMANDEVDPETFFLETFDIVQLPAVKKARLAMCESLNNKKSLKAALQESYDAANDEDKKVMKETLDNLDIKLDETVEDEIPVEDPEAPIEETLVEAEETPVEETEEVSAEEVEVPVEVETPVEDTVEEAPEALTIGAFADELKDYDKELPLEWKPIVIDGKEYHIEAVAFDDSEEGKILAEVSYALPEEEIAINDEEAVAEEPAEKEPEVPAEEAGDAGEDEVIESLKEAVRQKDLLENEVRDLKNQKTVSDAEVQGLKEELEKYKGGFMRVSELASKSTTLEKEKKALTEQLKLKNAEIKDLKSKVENHISLTESAKAEKVKVTELTEKLAKVQAEAEETEKTLTEALEASRKKAQDRTNLAKSYKAKYDAVVERYIANKAKMLGVRPHDITSKLAESYSLDDIDNVCNDLLEESRPQFGLVGGNPRVRVNESVKSEKKAIDPDNGYEIDDDLLILAGLK